MFAVPSIEGLALLQPPAAGPPSRTRAERNCQVCRAGSGVRGCWNGPQRSTAQTAKGRRTGAACRGQYRFSAADDCDAETRRPQRESGNDVFEETAGQAGETRRRQGPIVQGTGEPLVGP